MCTRVGTEQKQGSKHRRMWLLIIAEDSIGVDLLVWVDINDSYV